VIRLNGIGGVRFEKPGSKFRSGFFAKDDCISERSEESRIFFAAALPEMFCFRTPVHSPQPFNALTLQRI
jgi:hypothetical protein